MLKNYLKKILSLLNPSQKLIIAFGAIVLLALTATIIDHLILSKELSSDFENNYYKIYNVIIPKDLYFANEKVPVEDQRVREYLAREIIRNTSWKEQSMLLHKRSSKWFPVIEPILRKYNIPEDFKYIPLIESQFSNATSPRGAVGFWQIIASTATDFGLEVRDDVDERLDVVKSTKAACKYFNEAYAQLHNWTLVAASYNKGISGIQNQLTRQKAESYYNLKLNKETGDYVYRILAMKELIENPKVYGLKINPRVYKSHSLTKKIVIDTSITNLESFAIKNGIDLKTLKEYNPWLISNKLLNDSSYNYIIELPIEKFNADKDINDEGSNEEVSSLNKRDTTLAK